MKLLDDLLVDLPNGEILDVCIGLHWTAVVVRENGQKRCGLASTVVANHHHSAEPDVPTAGNLHRQSARELAQLAGTERSPLTGVGIAAINALLPPQPTHWRDINAEDVIAQQGAGKIVALIGSFPFIPRLRSRVGELFVLELNPGRGEFPATSAPKILPQAEVVAITSMTLVNHSLDGLLRLCAPHATVLLLGPSTPLSPRLFAQGIALLSGSVVTAIEQVVNAVKQGANFRQIHRAGVRLVTMSRDEMTDTANMGDSDENRT